MERQTVESSAVFALGYDPSSQSLEVEFHGKNGQPGKVWRYAPVTADLYEELTAPEESIGRVFAAKIKTNPAIVGFDVTDEVAAA